METLANNTLSKKWEALLEKQPNLRIRNAAQELGVSEVELLATKCGTNVSRLKPEFQNILTEIKSLGKVMALTRNNDVVHERKGIYKNASLENAHVGLFVGEDIDLRIFFQCWKSAFAVTEISNEKPRYSIQFFAKDGTAVHKIYLTPQSDLEAYKNLVEKYRNEDQSTEESVQASPEKAPELQDSEIDISGFQQEWLNLKDTHHFFGMLKKYKVSRTQALRLAPEGNYAIKVDPKVVRAILEKAAETQTPIMVFVGNPGMIQIHTGPVKKLMEYGEWYNVLDPDFNLHIKESALDSCWVVRKPTEDGTVTALECFNAEGEQIAQFFGKRKPGIPELQEWRDIVSQVEESCKI
ncbi:MAG: ChuX/HutX family heme-like substrate-binding protein [Chitinophagales bacterium]